MTTPTAPDRPAWWRLLAHAALRETQRSYYATWRDAASLSGEKSLAALDARRMYREHVQQHGRYSLPRRTIR